MKKYSFTLYKLRKPEKNFDEYCCEIISKYNKTTIEYNHRTTTYDEAYAVCKFCGEEAHDLVVEDMNNKRRSFALSDIQ